MIKQLIAGLILGLLIPFIGIFLILVLLKPEFSFSDITTHFWFNKSFSPTIQLSLILNLGTFFLLDRMGREVMSRGIIAGTLIWGFYLFYIIFGL